jgi:hypothetical protein
LCRRVCEVLLDHCGESIQSIGELAVNQVVHPAHCGNHEFRDSIGRAGGSSPCGSPIA